MLAKHASEYSAPDVSDFGDQIDGRLDVLLKSPEWLVEERDLVYNDAELRVESDGEEWPSEPEIRLAEEQVGDNVFEWDGEWRDVEVLYRIPQGVWSKRERAASAAEDLMERQSSVSRVILAGVVLDYVALHLDGGVWSDYQRESRGESVSGFLGWVSAREFRGVLSDRGGELFPEFEELFDVSQRTAKDTLEALRYFRGGEN